MVKIKKRASNVNTEKKVQKIARYCLDIRKYFISNFFFYQNMYEPFECMYLALSTN